MTPPPPPGPELFGPLLARLRSARGWSQPALAARLCAASGTPTVTRHEISRWERQARIPGGFWLDWLAVVLEVPRGRLAGAAEASRDVRRRLADPATPAVRGHTALVAAVRPFLPRRPRRASGRGRVTGERRPGGPRRIGGRRRAGPRHRRIGGRRRLGW